MTTYLIAASVRGEAVHARLSSERISVCGVENVSCVDEPFNIASAWACERCIRIVQARRASPAAQAQGEKE